MRDKLHTLLALLQGKPVRPIARERARRSPTGSRTSSGSTRSRSLSGWTALLDVLAANGRYESRARSSRSAAPTARARPARCWKASCGAAGYRTGLYTSPHLLRYNERVRIAGREADDAALCDAFAAVEAARGSGAADLFRVRHAGGFRPLCAAQASTPLVLEVGLGGRLDAVNALDAGLRGADQRRHRPRGISRRHARGDRPGEGRDLPRRPAGGRRRPGSTADACSTMRPMRRLLLHRPRLRLRRPGHAVVLLGPGGQAVRARASGAARRDAAAQRERARSPRSTACASACRSAMQDVRRGLAEVDAAGPLPGAAGPARRWCSTSRTTPRRRAVLAANLGDSGLRAGDDRRVRHAQRQGHRRRRARDGAAHHALAPGDAAGPARRGRRGTCARSCARKNPSSRSAQHATPRRRSPRRRKEAGENDKIVVFGSFLTVAEVMRLSAPAAPAHGRQDVNTLKRRGRRRLVGAIALVLAAVIVLPMVFDPEPRGSAPPVSVRIPGEDEPAFEPKVTPTAPARRPPRCRRQGAEKAAARRVAGSKAPRGLPRSPRRRGRSAEASAEAESATRRQRPLPRRRPTRARARPRLRWRTSSSSSRSAPIADPGSVIEQAARRRRFPTTPSRSPRQGGTVTRVRAGPFASRDAAEQGAAAAEGPRA